MRSIICLLAISFSLLTSCSTKKGDAFVFAGTIRGAENKLVKIETMKFPNINQYPKYTLIDSVRADEQGKFKIEDYLPERMICRITVEGNDYNYYIVSLYNENMVIDADINKQMKPDISGSAPTEVLYSFIDNMRDMNFEQSKINDSISKYQYAGNDSMLEVYRQKRKQSEIDYKQNVKNFVDTTSEISNAIIGLEGLTFTDDFDFIKSEEQKLKSGKDSASAYLAELSAKIKLHETVLAKSFIGKPAIDIIQPDANGNMLKLSDLKGKIVLLDFWASWCGPCRKENPNVVKAYQKYKDKGFTIFSVSLDTKKDNWLAAVKQDGLIWPTHVCALNDTDNKAAIDYGITGIPMSYLIDRDGIIIAQNVRGPALDAKLSELLSE